MLCAVCFESNTSFFTTPLIYVVTADVNTNNMGYEGSIPSFQITNK
jgi:hypothetical protein